MRKFARHVASFDFGGADGIVRCARCRVHQSSEDVVGRGQAAVVVWGKVVFPGGEDSAELFAHAFHRGVIIIVIVDRTVFSRPTTTYCEVDR